MNLKITHFFNLYNILFILLIDNLCVNSESSIIGYINSVKNFFGSSSSVSNQDSNDNNIELIHSIPYEVSKADEKFIAEAIKLTGVAISELDSCQQRVVLKLRSDCNKMNDEQLAKMAVHLLNCQSYVEGRKTFPCTDDMNIKQCTSNMDSDTWTSYHLMSNRARAVCYTVRQSQFRGMAEHTVNRLMESAKDQLASLSRIATNQENILELAETTYDSLSKAQSELSQQQKDLQRAQLHGQLTLEDNIIRLLDEKRLIHETHEKLIQMTREVQNRLEHSTKMIEDHSTDNKLSHKELLHDVILVQEKANDLFQKIDTYSEILLKQNIEFKNVYESTLRNLQEVNTTVHLLVNLVGGTRQALEERISWVLLALGGTDQAVGRLYLVSWHFGLLLIAMLACAFLSARNSTRLLIIILLPLNLAMAFNGNDYLDCVRLVCVIGVFAAAQTLIIWAINLKDSLPEAITWTKTKLLTPSKSEKCASSKSSFNQEEEEIKNNTYNSILNEEHQTDDEIDQFDEFLTPPVSRAGYSSSRSRSNTPSLLLFNNAGIKISNHCVAKTRTGSLCKGKPYGGFEYCYRHFRGNSVLNS